MSLGAEGRDGDGWQQWQQGWGDHWGMNYFGRNNSGRNSPRMMNKGTYSGSGSYSPRSPYNGNGNDFNQMGSYRPGSANHQMMGGMQGDHWKYNKPGYGSPYGSPRGSMTNMPHGSMS